LTPWTDLDLRHFLVRGPRRRGFGHRDDFNRFIVFVYDGVDDHVIIFFFGGFILLLQ
jgi:hypothetical protein